MEVTAEATNGARYRTTVAAPYDPGYSGTAVMLGQAALALVEDVDDLPDAAGVLTPATRPRRATGRAAARAPVHAGDGAPSRLTAAAIFSASMRSSRSIPEIGFV